MKNKNLNMLLKTSILSNKLLSVIYCLFVVVSTILILITISITMPLSENINSKVRNHISNREAVIEFNENCKNDNITESIDEMKGMEHIKAVYRMSPQLTVTEQTGVLNDNYKFDFIHTGSNPVITQGRTFKENETEVAVVPENLKDFDIENNTMRDIPGKNLLNKSLVFTDICNNSHKVKVVGVYSSTDPLYSEKQILIPQNDLNKYTDKILANTTTGDLSKNKSYIILVDSADNVDEVIDDVQHLGATYIQQSLIDGDKYSVALYILIAILAFFITMEVLGFFILLKNNINGRTKELALYRSLGYKSNQLFYIIFSEHFCIGVFSIIIGLIITLILNSAFINPLIYEMLGNTIMEMTVSISPINVAFIFLLFVAVLLIVCRNSVKRSEKIDLTILLRQ